MKTLLRFVAGEIGPYLGGAAHRRACSHSRSHSLFPRPAFANLSSSFLGKRVLLDCDELKWADKHCDCSRLGEVGEEMRRQQYVGGMESDVIGSGVSNMQDSELLLRNVASKKRIVYTTTRPNDIKTPFEEMLENDVGFGAPDKRSGGFLNFALALGMCRGRKRKNTRRFEA
ncbi:hypothetical protein Tco_1356478 [Tanacetum coccineum]